MTESISSTPRVVVGVDGSRQSKDALRWGARIAAGSGAQLVALAAWEFPTTFGWNAAPVGYSPKLDIQKCLVETVDQVFGNERPKDMRLLTEEGGAAHVLMKESKNALMLVVGSRGHGGFTGMLIGSVSSKVAEYATCPVLVVHGDVPAAEVAA